MPKRSDIQPEEIKIFKMFAHKTTRKENMSCVIDN